MGAPHPAAGAPAAGASPAAAMGPIHDLSVFGVDLGPAAAATAGPAGPPPLPPSVTDAAIGGGLNKTRAANANAAGITGTILTSPAGLTTLGSAPGKTLLGG